MKRSIFIMLATVLVLPVFSQNFVTGTLVNANTNKPISLAQITIDNQKGGTTSDSSGYFKIRVKQNKSYLTIQTIGYLKKTLPFSTKKGITDLGTIFLKPKIYALNEVNITSGLAQNHRDPVSVTTLSARTVKNQLGDQPLPLALQSVPGVFSIRDGGGSGDASISIRGFKQNNVGLLLNGIPINGVENGLVYWSNWLGLNDAAAEIQVQQGPGLANMATDAVGGSINIITRNNNRPKGGTFSYQLTDYGNQKLTLTMNTGQIKNGWSLNFMGAYFNGPGYVDATYVHGFSYFLSANKQLNKKNHINITLMGSPQHHGQRTLRLSDKEVQLHGIKYNKDWGGLDGKMINASENFYHKPFLSINHDLSISENKHLSNSIFISYGNGGGKWSDAFHYAPSIFDYRTASGQIDWNQLYEMNANNTAKYVLANGDTVTGYSTHVGTKYLSTFVTAGFLSTYKQKINNNLTFTGGLYYRYLDSYLRQQITNLMGGQFFIEDYAWSLSGVAGRNQIKTVGDIIKVDNNSIIHQMNAYARLVYHNSHWNMYGAIGGNNHWYQRIDRYNYINHTKSTVIKKPGFDARFGIAYNFSPFSRLFFNTAYISKAPFFNFVFGNYTNVPVQNLHNEKIKTAEMGYIFHTPAFDGRITAYYTLWEDVSLLSDQYVQLANNEQSRAMINGLNSLHKGIEGQLKYHISSKLQVGALFSWGGYRWQNNVSAQLLNNNNVVTDTVHAYAKGLFVGGTAQQQLGVFVDSRLFNKINLKVEWLHYNGLFADFNPTQRNNPENHNQPYQFPSYGTVNAYASLPFRIANRPTMLQINGYNLLNLVHIVSGVDGAENNLNTFRGFWSFGRNFNIMLKMYF